MIWIWFLNSIAVFITAKILPGVVVENFWTAIIVAAILAIVNTFVRPILLFFSLPFTILTLGLFIFIVDAVMVLLVNKLVTGFEVKSFVWALLFAVIMTPVSSLLHKLLA